MLQTSSCDRKLSSHHNVILRAEQTSFSRFLFPLYLIFFLQRLFKSCCQNCLPLLLFWWHHPLPWLAPVFSFRVQFAFISLGFISVLPLLHFPVLSAASLHFWRDCRSWRPCVEVSIHLLTKEVSPGLFQKNFIYIFIAQAHIKHLLRAGHGSGYCKSAYNVKDMVLELKTTR